MRVLRSNRDSVMAMLEAFVHDPLINWRLLNTPDAAPDAAMPPVATAVGLPAQDLVPEDLPLLGALCSPAPHLLGSAVRLHAPDLVAEDLPLLGALCTPQMRCCGQPACTKSGA